MDVSRIGSKDALQCYIIGQSDYMQLALGHSDFIKQPFESFLL